MGEKCIPPEMLEIRHRYIDKAVAASIALQAGLITGDEFRSIVDLTNDWYRFIRQLYSAKNRTYGS